MEGVTDWLMVRNHRIFLPPPTHLRRSSRGSPTTLAVTTPVGGRGEVAQADSRYNEEPICVRRVPPFSDLESIVAIVLSLLPSFLPTTPSAERRSGGRYAFPLQAQRHATRT